MYHRFTRLATQPTHWWYILAVNMMFFEFTCSSCSCAGHIIASVSFLKFPLFNRCHLLFVLTFFVYFRNLPWSWFYSHWLVFSSFKCFVNASGSSISDYPFSSATNFFTLTKIIVQTLHFQIRTFFATYQPFSSFFSGKIECNNFFFRMQTPIYGHELFSLNVNNYQFVQSNTPPPYLIIHAVHEFIPAITFHPFICNLSNFFTHLIILMFSRFPSFLDSWWNLTATLPKNRTRQGESLSCVFRLVVLVSNYLSLPQDQHCTLVQTKYHTNIIIKILTV